MQWLVWPGGQPTLSNTTSPHNFPLPLSQWERQVLKSLCKMMLAFLLNIKSFMNEWFVVWLRPKGGGWRVEGGGLNKKQGQAQRISEEIWDFCDSYNASSFICKVLIGVFIAETMYAVRLPLLLLWSTKSEAQKISFEAKKKRVVICRCSLIS